MPGLNPVVGRTVAEAEGKHQYLQSLIHPDVGRELLANALGDIDLSTCEEDAQLPASVRAAALATGKSDARLVVDMWEYDGLTLRQMYHVTPAQEANER